MTEVKPDFNNAPEYNWHLNPITKTDSVPIDVTANFELNMSSSEIPLSSFQSFMMTAMNPHIAQPRCMLGAWSTGSGKTRMTCQIAMKFFRHYEKATYEGQNSVGYIWIVGFNEAIFQEELLSNHIYGFVSKAELNELASLRRDIFMSRPNAKETYISMKREHRRRLVNRKYGGFFKFIGYRELVNHLFVGIQSLSETEIVEGIEKGTVQVNDKFAKAFNNSLIIADEIHNVYNSIESNSWGVALKTILKIIPSVRSIFLTATPISNAPSEIIDLLNLLMPEENLKRTDFFDGEQLLPGATEKIRELARGRVSYLQDNNPESYPSFEFVGESFGIPYIKFNVKKMSEWQETNYRKALETTGDLQYIHDVCIPSPKDTSIGIFQVEDFQRQQFGSEYTEETKVTVKDKTIFMDPSVLSKYSAKYSRLIECLKESLPTRRKAFIYHNMIHMSGVLCIEHVLSSHNYLDGMSAPTLQTICHTCGKSMESHAPIDKVKTGGNRDILIGDDLVLKMAKDSMCRYIIGKSTLIPMGNFYYVSGSLDTATLKTLRKHLDNPINLYESSGSQKINTPKIRMNLSVPLDKKFQLIPVGPDEWYIFDKGKKCHGLLTRKELFTKNKFVKNSVKNNLKFGRLLHEGKKFKTHGENAMDDSSKSGGNIDNLLYGNDGHEFTPARYLMVHGNMSKEQVKANLEKFNSPDNTRGNQYAILVGSRIMRESHTLKAVRDIYVCSRPDHIPQLIQIKGRAVRNNSHALLPIQERNVNIHCLCAILSNTRNYSETWTNELLKYKEKVSNYQTAQQIEKVFHEVAIDQALTYETIKKSMPKDSSIEMIPYEPINRKVGPSETHIQGRTIVFHGERVVQVAITLIKRLFVEVSKIWKYQDLISVIQQPVVHGSNGMPISLHTVIDFSKVPISLINVAIYQLVTPNNSPYLSVDVDGSYETNLFSSSNIIHTNTGQRCSIMHIGEYFVLLELDNQMKPKREISQFTVTHSIRNPLVLDVNKLASHIDEYDYDNKRIVFFNNWKAVPISMMELAICEHGVVFHLQFIEETVKYVFDCYCTEGFQEDPQFHEFYFKMLYYYDLFSLIIFAYTANDPYQSYYRELTVPFKSRDVKLKAIQLHDKMAERAEALKKKGRVRHAKKLKERNGNYISSSGGDEDEDNDDETTTSKRTTIFLDEDIFPDAPEEIQSSGMLNVLRSSVWKTSATWAPKELRHGYEILVRNSLKLFADRKRNTSFEKVSAQYLPVGHFLAVNPKLYQAGSGWSDYPNYQPEELLEENNIIIGFDERAPNAVHVHFKIRSPVQNIKKQNDARKIETGSMCRTYGKTRLVEIAKKLKIELDESVSVEDLCHIIKCKLMRNELKERMRKSNIRWFYNFYDIRPEMRDMKKV